MTYPSISTHTYVFVSVCVCVCLSVVIVRKLLKIKLCKKQHSTKKGPVHVEKKRKEKYIYILKRDEVFVRKF